MKKGIFICFLASICLLTNQKLIAQEPENQFWNRVRFGGGLGLSFTNGFFSGTLAPSAIYEFNPQLAFGVGLNGTYNSLKDRYNSTILGGSLITLFNPIQELQLSAEYEQLHVSRKYESFLDLEKEQYWVPAFFIGAGFRNQQVTIGIRYDLLFNEEKSIYASAWMPFVRVFF